MNTALWIAQGLLAAAFLGAGSMKLFRSHATLKADPRMGYANDFPGGFIKFIGAAEILGAIGLIAPGLAGVATMLTPVAALGLFAIMFGAAVTHLKRGEDLFVIPAVILGAMTACVAYARFALMPL